MEIPKKRRISVLLLSLLPWKSSLPQVCSHTGYNLVLIKLDARGGRKQVVEPTTQISWVQDFDGTTPVWVDIKPVLPNRTSLCDSVAHMPITTCKVAAAAPTAEGNNEYTFAYCSDPTVVPAACPASKLIKAELRVRPRSGAQSPNDPMTFWINDLTLMLDDDTNRKEVNHLIPNENTCLLWRSYSDDRQAAYITFGHAPTTTFRAHSTITSLELPSIPIGGASTRIQGDFSYTICDKPGGLNCLDPTIHILGSGAGVIGQQNKFLTLWAGILAGVGVLFGLTGLSMMYKFRDTRKEKWREP